MADRTVSIDILGKDKTSAAFNSAGKSAGRAEGAFKSTGKSMLALGRVAATAGVAAVGLGVILGTKFVSDARESAKVTALTAAVIKSTGGVAQVTAKHVDALATAIANKTGIDDEAIASSENLLLTFTNVRNETGKGNKIFDRATAAVADMSVALGQDGKAGAIQLGKALNDPVKGITALSRVGVSFTKKQKAHIKSLVDQGKTLKAQKVILKELGKEFGGAAEAAATPMDKLKVTLGNVSEALGAKLIPFIDKGATVLLKFIRGMQSGIGPGGQFAAFLRQVAGAVKAALPYIQQVGTYIMGTVVPAVVNLVRTVGPPLLAALQAGFGFFKTNVLPILKGVAAFIIGTVVPVVGGILKQALEGVKGAFKQVGAAIERNRPQLETLVGAFKTVVTFIVTKVLPVLGPILKGYFHILGKYISLVIGIVGHLVTAFQSAVGGIKSAVAKIKSVVGGIKTAFENARAAVSAKLHAAVALVKALPGRITGAIGDLGSLLLHAGGQVIQGLIDGIQAGVGKLKTKLGEITSLIPLHKGPPAKDRKLLFPAGLNIMEGLNKGLQTGSKKIKETLKTITDNIKSHLADLRSQGHDIASSAADSVRGILDISGIGAAGSSPHGILAGFAAQAGAFAKALAKMSAHKLAPAIIAAVAAAGPSALGAANAFASESASSVRSDNRSVATIDRAARSAGSTARGASGIDKKIDATNHLLVQIHKALSGEKVSTLRITKGGDLIVDTVNKKNHNQKRRGHQ